MHLSTHPVDGIPGPQDTSWVDAVLTALRRRAVPAGALVAAPLGIGAGCVVALWDDAADTAGTSGGFAAGGVTVGPGTGYALADHKAGPAAGPARFLQLTTFAGRPAEWLAAYDRAVTERIWPAVKDVPGTVGHLVGETAGGRVVATLAESVDALEAGGAAIMSTELLPWEDPAQLTGPDALTILRLLHADLPVGATR